MSTSAADTGSRVLVIGSPATVGDGSYQKAIVDAETSQGVEKQLLDRILDGGQRASPVLLSTN